MQEPIKIPTVYTFDELKPKKKNPSNVVTDKNNCLLFYTSKQMNKFLKKCAKKK